MNLATERMRDEQAFHDRQAHDRAEYFRHHGTDLCFEDDTYLDHESWIRPALHHLGDVTGHDVLDLGCGHGMAAVLLARRGGRVTAFDLSPGYLSEAGARAQANHASVRLVQADGNRLPFADASFDRIWGNAILHHLDTRQAADEVLRVLRPNGRAVFCEPWGENPVLNWARCHLPYPGKQRTVDERPLSISDVEVLRQVFSRVDVHHYQFLSMVRRLAPAPHLTRWLESWDRRLLFRFPALRRFCRYVVLILHR